MKTADLIGPALDWAVAKADGTHEWKPSQHDLTYEDAMRLKQYGPTPLIAAMRYFVTSRLGDEIDIPEELK